MGPRAVRRGAGGGDPRQRQPGLPHARARLRAAPVGHPAARLRRRVQDERLPRDGRRGAGRLPGPAARGRARLGRLGGAPGRRRRAARGRAGRARGRAGLRRPDQPAVHERHDRVAQGRDAHPPQPAQQRLLRRRAVRLHRPRPDRDPGALLPLLRHGHGQPRRDLARCLHGRPRAGLRARRDAARRRRGALHGALRRADDVHRHAGRPGLRRGRPDLAAHRDHGRGAVPGRGHAARDRRDAHERGVHLLRDDGDLAGLDPDPPRRPPRAPRRHGRPRRPARRGPRRRSRDGPDRPGRRGGRAVHPRLLRDARLPRRPRADRGGDRRRRLDAHGRPGRHGRRGLRPDRGPHQGPRHPRRREHLAARGRGVPLRAPRHRGRPGRRRARRALRRGALRVPPAAPRGGGARRRRRARLLRRAAGALQGPAPRARRRRVPDDRHRQGPEVPAARAGRRAPRACPRSCQAGSRAA